MENNITINNRIPQLRFPGYTGDWEEKSFDVICHTITPPLKLQSSQYSSSGKFPIVDQSQTLICGWTNDSSGLLRNTPYIIFGDHTCVLKYIDFPFIQGADGVKILGSNKKDNSKFIYQLLLSNPVKQDGYKRHFSDLKEKIFLLPPTLEEQTKIAECLSSIDEIISVEESKVESLKAHKKGLMQQLFPQPGATTPALRFPGFTGEWEEKTLGEVATSFSGGTPKSGESRFYGGPIPFIRSGEIHGNKTELFITEDGLKNSSAKLVKKGDLLFALYGATSGEVDLSKIEGAINQAILCIRSEVIDTCFLYNYLLHRKDYITSHFLQGGQGNLSSDIIMSLAIPFPPFAEQQKVASCLTEMDNIISAQEHRVESLKAHKKGLMQQLFPQL